MRASEIQYGMSYAVSGREIQLAKVQVYGREPRIGGAGADPTNRFRCLVEAGEVYTGWKKEHGALDMNYAGPGERVLLESRAFLRPWTEEEIRRAQVLTQRETIRSAMSEMDRLLTELGLPDAQMQLVQLPDGFIAVTVLGIEDVRRLHDQKTESTPRTDPRIMDPVPGEPGAAGARREVSGPP
jgi:hypothetical protein